MDNFSILENLEKNEQLYFEFLLNLNDKTLTNLCRINETIRSYCNNNHLWLSKINKLYPEIPIPLSYTNKLKIFYILLKYLSLFDITKLAIDTNDIKLLNYLWEFDKSYNFPGIERNFEESIGKGNEDIWLWAVDHNIKLDYTRIANRAAYNQNFKLLGELAKDDIYPNDIAWEEAIIYGHLDIIKWLYEHNIDPEIDYEEMVNAPAGDGYINILEWFTKMDFYPNDWGADSAAMNGQIDVLNWLASKNIYPTIEGRDLAIQNLQYKVLDWLEKNMGFSKINDEIMINPTGLINGGAIDDNIKETKRLYDLGYQPDQEFIDDAAIESSFKTLNFLALHGFYPSREAVSDVITMGNYKMLQWLLEKEIYPLSL